MSHSHYHKLLDRGRKAGLNTQELYQALSSRPPTPGDIPVGQSDGNGFVVQVLTDGHRDIRPGVERK